MMVLLMKSGLMQIHHFRIRSSVAHGYQKGCGYSEDHHFKTIQQQHIDSYNFVATYREIYFLEKLFSKL